MGTTASSQTNQYGDSKRTETRTVAVQAEEGGRTGVSGPSHRV